MLLTNTQSFIVTVLFKSCSLPRPICSACFCAIDFISSTARIPETSTDVFAYNFYGSQETGKVPQFKIYFTNALSASQGTLIPTKQYAIISSYKLTADGDPIALENGKIYRVKDIILDDLKVQPDESGNELA